MDENDVDVGWALAVFKQLCGGASTLTVDPLARAIADMLPEETDARQTHEMAITLLDTLDSDRNGVHQGVHS